MANDATANVCLQRISRELMAPISLRQGRGESSLPWLASEVPRFGRHSVDALQAEVYQRICQPKSQRLAVLAANTWQESTVVDCNETASASTGHSLQRLLALPHR